MVRSISVRNIQKLDKVAIERYGVPSLCLMENAGKATADIVLKQLKNKKKPHVSVVCGLGNNAGDGFVVARHLINAGVQTDVYLIGSASKLKADAAVNYKILKKCKHPIKNINRSLQFKKTDLVVDAIFGVGLNRNISDPFENVINTINASGKRVVSIDVPSGLDGDTGRIYGVCVKADITVSFTFLKKGFFKDQGPKHVGKAIVVDIGIPVILKNKIR